MQKKLIISISVMVPVIVAILMFSPTKLSSGYKGWVLFLPHLNAVINTATALILLLGFYFIKSGKQDYHKTSMITAFFLGTIFLVSYLIYHSLVPSTIYEGTGVVRYLYYFLLLTHILFAFIVVPLVLMAFYFALKSNFIKHKRIVKFTFPIWMYVSVTGVLVYLMISPYYGN